MKPWIDDYIVYIGTDEDFGWNPYLTKYNTYKIVDIGFNTTLDNRYYKVWTDNGYHSLWYNEEDFITVQEYRNRKLKELNKKNWFRRREINIIKIK